MGRETVITKKGQAAQPLQFVSVLWAPEAAEPSGSGGLIFADRGRLSYSVEIRGAIRILEVAITESPGGSSFRLVLFSDPEGMPSSRVVGRLVNREVALLHFALVSGDGLWMEARTDRGLVRGELHQVARNEDGEMATPEASS
jgi:hypothetical protein